MDYWTAHFSHDCTVHILLGNSYTASGRSDPGGRYSLGRRATFFFRARCTSLVTHSFLLPSSISLSYFILAIPMCERLGKHSCMSYTFNKFRVLCNRFLDQLFLYSLPSNVSVLR